MRAPANLLISLVLIFAANVAAVGLMGSSCLAEDESGSQNAVAPQAQPAKGSSEGRPERARPQSDSGKPGPAADAQKGDAKPAEEQPKSEAAAPKIVRRDGLDLPQGDPAELQATVGEDGKVAFRFRNQDWVNLIGWLSDISGQPIDWQELPADAVNLVSPERLTVAETADLINRHLLARGYTMLELRGGITIAKTDAVNPGMVRRVSIEELEKLPDHRFVRTMLDAGWLSAEKLAEELKPMLSGSGKLTALATTNRLEAMDAAVNLRQVAKLLSEERDMASRDALAPEFRLQHIPAEEAKTLLEKFLGVEKKEAPPMSREQLQMMQRMQQQGGGQPPPKQPEIEISIVANVRQNSVLVRAPIDRVAIAAEFIKRIDVPGGSLRSLADASSRVEVFRLVSLDPEKLIEIAQEMNVLEPTTRIRVDKDNAAVIVSGAATDRFIIKSLIERLDGGKRRFEVLQLRRLDAADVAESISFLMGKKEDKDKGSNRNRYAFYGWGGGNENESKDEDEFRVAANAGYRQVLLWANESEMEEVRSLLMKLGELPPPGGSAQTVRVIEASATPETLEYLKQLKAQWQGIAPNELILPSDEEFSRPLPASKQPDEQDEQGEQDEQSEQNVQEEQDGESEQDDQAQQDDAAPPRSLDLDVRSDRLHHGGYTLAAQPNQPQAAAVEIRLDANGNLILSSSDTEALDALENMMLDRKPPTRSYHVFEVKNSSVILLTSDLEDYFKEDDDKQEDDSNRFSSWFWGGGDNSKDSGPTGLARSNKLRFLPNSDTGTIIVTGASPGQLQTIQELIELWDVAEPINPRRSRFTKLVTIRYGRSEKIADTVKEAYRDLLSSNDKAFAAGGKSNQQRASNREAGSGLEDSESGRDGGGNDFSFSGKLSLGVDQIGNTLLVSAEGESLLDLIVAMIEKLDVAAQPGGEIEILSLSGDVSPETLRQAMSAFGAEAASAPTRTPNPETRSGPERARDRRSRGTN